MKELTIIIGFIIFVLLMMLGVFSLVNLISCH